MGSSPIFRIFYLGNLHLETDAGFFACLKIICKKGIPDRIYRVYYDMIAKYDTFRNTGLTSVTLHEGLTKIEDWAFHDCLKLKKIRIPKSVTNIGELALGIRYNSQQNKDDPHLRPGPLPESR